MCLPNSVLNEQVLQLQFQWGMTTFKASIMVDAVFTVNIQFSEQKFSAVGSMKRTIGLSRTASKAALKAQRDSIFPVFKKLHFITLIS